MIVSNQEYSVTPVAAFGATTNDNFHPIADIPANRQAAGMWYLAIKAALAVQANSPDATPREFQPRDGEQIERIASEAIERGFFPGISIAVARDGEISFAKHLGTTSLQSGRPVVPATRFRLGSISKLVTAAIILKLVQDGRVDLHAPVASVLPDDAAIGRLPRSVTIERLLNHTSALPDFTREELEAKVSRGNSTDGDLRTVLARPLTAIPGQQWAYADAPYRILSRVVERVSGVSFGQYVSDRLGPALGLPSLQLCEPGSPDHADGYLSEGGKLRPEAAYSIRGLLGEGGLCATTKDLARLPAALAGAGWLTEASLARMTAPTKLADGTIVDYGLGVRGGLLGTYRAWGHTGGGLDGSWAAVAYYPSNGLSVAVTANGTGGDVDAATLQARIAAVVLGVERPKAVAADVAVISPLTGTYVRTGQTTCLFLSGGNLVRQKSGTTTALTPLLWQEDNIFARLDYPLDRLVFQVEGQRAVAYRVYYDGFFVELWRRSSEASCPPAK